MSMVSAGFVAIDPVSSGSGTDTGITTRLGGRKRVLVDRATLHRIRKKEAAAEAAARAEQESTLAVIAEHEARLRQLDAEPPVDLSPAKLEVHREAIQRTIKELRRQLPLLPMKGR